MDNLLSSLLSKVSGLEVFQRQSSLIVLVLRDLFQEVSHVQQIGFVSSHQSRQEAFPLVKLSEDCRIGPVSQLFTEPGTRRSATKFRKCVTYACNTMRMTF